MIIRKAILGQYFKGLHRQAALQPGGKMEGFTPKAALHGIASRPSSEHWKPVVLMRWQTVHMLVPHAYTCPHV